VLELLRWDTPGPYVVAFSTRAGGVSAGPFASLNLGLLTDDDRENALENRRRLCAAAGADAEGLVYPRQVHGARVLAGREDLRGAEADGMVTDEPGRPLAVVSADCAPVVVVREGNGAPAVAALHAGWRGLLAGIAAAGAAALGGGRLAGVVGPSIGPCCYEVGEDVAAPFRAAFGADVVRDGRLDLWSATERSLRAAGVARVERLDLCTACDPARFFSHRRDRGATGRQGVVAYVA
jgi:YfiH family protein